MYCEQLPAIEIHGTQFQIDVWTRELIETADPLNRISFDSMQATDNGYTFAFDPKAREIPFQYDPDLPFEQQQHDPGVVKVEIPFMARIDPEGMRKKFSIPEADALPQKDEDFKCRQDLLNRRLGGQLPKITIEGKPYFVDVRCGELRYFDHRFSSNNPRIVKLDLCDESDDGKELFFLFDKKRHLQVPLDPELLAIPPDLVVIAIPAAHWLDPVGLARRYGVNDTEYVDRYPIREKLEYRIVPMEQTLLPTLVKENREKRGLTMPEKEASGQCKKSKGRKR